MADWREKAVDEIEWTTRGLGVLRNTHITNIGQLSDALDRNAFAGVPSCGNKTRKEFEEVVSSISMGAAPRIARLHPRMPDSLRNPVTGPYTTANPLFVEIMARDALRGLVGLIEQRFPEGRGTEHMFFEPVQKAFEAIVVLNAKLRSAGIGDQA